MNKMTFTTQTPRLSRRQFLKISAVSGGVLAGGTLWGMAKQTTHTVKETRLLMGTLIHLALVTDDERQGERVVGTTFAEIERLVKILDHRNPQAALAQLEEQIGATEYELEQLAHTTQEATQNERFDMIKSLSVEYSATEEKLESLMHEWEKLAHELAQATPEGSPQAEMGGAAVST